LSRLYGQGSKPRAATLDSCVARRAPVRRRGARGFDAMVIRTLIVDDEPAARDQIAMMLQEESDVELVGQCGDGPGAVESIGRLAPHLVFLDIEIPRGDGFDVVGALEPGPLPFVVFVTGHDAHALRAFDVQALDYLLKPIDPVRVQRAVGRARAALAHLENDELAERVRAVATAPHASPSPHDRFVVRRHGRVFFVRPHEIDWVEGSGNYVRLHVGPDTHTIRQTMAGIEARLGNGSGQFVRIHRSQIVNIDRIRELERLFNGEYAVILHGGARLTLSRSYRDRVRKRIGDAL
jgi:two-component system, LytTR family, response regulator